MLRSNKGGRRKERVKGGSNTKGKCEEGTRDNQGMKSPASEHCLHGTPCFFVLMRARATSLCFFLMKTDYSAPPPTCAALRAPVTLPPSISPRTCSYHSISAMTNIGGTRTPPIVASSSHAQGLGVKIFPFRLSTVYCRWKWCADGCLPFSHMVQVRQGRLARPDI